MYSGLLCGQTHVLAHLSLWVRIHPHTVTYSYSRNTDLARTHLIWSVSLKCVCVGWRMYCTCMCVSWLHTLNALQLTNVWPYLLGPHTPGTVQSKATDTIVYKHLHDTMQLGESEKSEGCAKSVSFNSHHIGPLSIPHIHFCLLQNPLILLLSFPTLCLIIFSSTRQEMWFLTKPLLSFILLWILPPPSPFLYPPLQPKRSRMAETKRRCCRRRRWRSWRFLMPRFLRTFVSPQQWRMLTESLLEFNNSSFLLYYFYWHILLTTHY